MNITEITKTWKVESRYITNRKTGDVKLVTGIPQDNTLALMSLKTFCAKCSKAFITGRWE
jgi:hypothetical protein